MKTTLIMAAFAAAAAGLVSCDKITGATAYEAGSDEYDGEIVFSAGGPGLELETKALEVNNFSSFNAIATSGEAESESEVWKTTANKGGTGKFDTGKYWPSTDKKYNFYGSNVSMQTGAQGATVTVPDCGTDVLCAYTPKPTFNVSPVNLTFSHILSRLTTISVTSNYGYVITVTDIKLKSVVHSGVYNLRTQEWSSKGSVSDVNLVADGSDNDAWMIPGTYTLQIAYTLTKGDFSQSYEAEQDIAVEAGKKHVITGNVTKDPAQQLNISVNIVPWTPRTGTVTL
ncbi:MAG: fimbrillin family protein [Bacteroidales bacterium]|nr:fimbrillin family protein [Bacteroidales bacterium]